MNELQRLPGVVVVADRLGAERHDLDALLLT